MDNYKTMRTTVKIMTITITVREETKKRLDDYKIGEMTYDDLLNYLMDTIPTEDIAEEDIKEHYRRLETFKPLSKDDFNSFNSW